MKKRITKKMAKRSNRNRFDSCQSGMHSQQLIKYQGKTWCADCIPSNYRAFDDGVIDLCEVHNPSPYVEPDWYNTVG